MSSSGHNVISLTMSLMPLFFFCFFFLHVGAQFGRGRKEPPPPSPNPHPAVNICQQRAVLHSRLAHQDWFLQRMKLDLILKAKSPHWFFDDIFCIYLHQLWRQVASKKSALHCNLSYEFPNSTI